MTTGASRFVQVTGGARARDNALKDRIAVHHVESVDREGQTHAREPDVFREAHIDLGNVRVAEAVDLGRSEQMLRAFTAGAGDRPRIRDRVTLAGVDVEPERGLDHRDLISAGQTAGPLRVDEDAALRA